MEQTQRAAVFVLHSNISLYLVPICQSTIHFCRSMDVDLREFEDRVDVDQEVCWYAWFI